MRARPGSRVALAPMRVMIRAAMVSENSPTARFMGMKASPVVMALYPSTCCR